MSHFVTIWALRQFTDVTANVCTILQSTSCEQRHQIGILRHVIILRVISPVSMKTKLKLNTQLNRSLFAEKNVCSGWKHV